MLVELDVTRNWNTFFLIFGPGNGGWRGRRDGARVRLLRTGVGLRGHARPSGRGAGPSAERRRRRRAGRRARRGAQEAHAAPVLPRPAGRAASAAVAPLALGRQTAQTRRRTPLKDRKYKRKTKKKRIVSRCRP